MHTEDRFENLKTPKFQNVSFSSSLEFSTSKMSKKKKRTRSALLQHCETDRFFETFKYLKVPKRVPSPPSHLFALFVMCVRRCRSTKPIEMPIWPPSLPRWRNFFRIRQPTFDQVSQRSFSCAVGWSWGSVEVLNSVD